MKTLARVIWILAVAGFLSLFVYHFIWTKTRNTEERLPVAWPEYYQPEKFYYKKPAGALPPQRA